MSFVSGVNRAVTAGTSSRPWVEQSSLDSVAPAANAVWCSDWYPGEVQMQWSPGSSIAEIPIRILGEAAI